MLEHVSCHCHSKRHYRIPKSSKLWVESSKKRWSLIKLLLPIPLLAIPHPHDRCICKQMTYVLRCLEMIGFPHNHFVKIGGVPADPKFQVAKLVLPLNKHKAINPWSGFMYWLQNSCFECLVNHLLKSLFQVHRHWSTGCLLGCNTLI